MSAGPPADPDRGSDARPGLYLHVPFCSAICPYCDFAVRTGGPAARRRYVEALLLEISRAPGRRASGAAPEDAVAAARGAFFRPGVSFGTVYFGGGTPSLLDLDDLETLLGALRRHLPIAADARILLEANPEDLVGSEGGRRAAAWRRLGVSFLSLGVQSLDDEELAFLGRRHRAADAREAVERALEAGFPTVNVDLIYGLATAAAADSPVRPRSPAGWIRLLDAALALGAQHLSLYELEIHAGTDFARRRSRGELLEAPEHLRAELFRATHGVLQRAGWEVYEVSNFARSPQHRSPHNPKYWCHVPYLGLGPAAHSYADGVRWWNERSAPRWERRLRAGDDPIAAAEVLTPEQLALEAVMLGLRTADGLDLERLRRLTGIDLAAREAETLERWRGAGRVAVADGPVVPSLDGMAVADALAAELRLEP